jgi:hypothetical protein
MDSPQCFRPTVFSAVRYPALSTRHALEQMNRCVPQTLTFEQEIARKLKVVSYQDPQKVADGLSYIWDEKDKWGKIGRQMGWDPDNAKTKLKLIADRRNAIVHESDMDPISNVKNPISRTECRDVTDFIELCGKSIAQLVI